mmetsp:Transcript_25958/g.72456  ORF Transcript_25958/g.72456 Transcript_25958/m.72456 type:complete len:502 (-) Transcript_25958:241-1746(-)
MSRMRLPAGLCSCWVEAGQIEIGDIVASAGVGSAVNCRCIQAFWRQIRGADMARREVGREISHPRRGKRRRGPQPPVKVGAYTVGRAWARHLHGHVREDRPNSWQACREKRHEPRAGPRRCQHAGVRGRRKARGWRRELGSGRWPREAKCLTFALTLLLQPLAALAVANKSHEDHHKAHVIANGGLHSLRSHDQRRTESDRGKRHPHCRHEEHQRGRAMFDDQQREDVQTEVETHVAEDGYPSVIASVAWASAGEPTVLDHLVLSEVKTLGASNDERRHPREGYLLRAQDIQRINRHAKEVHDGLKYRDPELQHVRVEIPVVSAERYLLENRGKGVRDQSQEKNEIEERTVGAAAPVALASSSELRDYDTHDDCGRSHILDDMEAPPDESDGRQHGYRDRGLLKEHLQRSRCFHASEGLEDASAAVQEAHRRKFLDRHGCHFPSGGPRKHPEKRHVHDRAYLCEVPAVVRHRRSHAFEVDLVPNGRNEEQDSVQDQSPFAQ